MDLDVFVEYLLLDSFHREIYKNSELHTDLIQIQIHFQWNIELNYGFDFGSVCGKEDWIEYSNISNWNSF